MKLLIMTRGRVDAQRTIHSIPENWKDDTHFVCPPDECSALENRYHIETIPFFHDNPNQSNKFQWMLEGGVFPAEEKIVVLDDDLIFSRRVTHPDKVKLHTLRTNDEVQELEEMFREIEEHLNHVPECGVHPRQMGHQAPLPYKSNGKIITVYGVNRNLLQEYGFGRDWRVDYLPIFGDVFLNCHLLYAGAENRLVTRFCVDWGASQAPGGCSIYRTPALQERAVDLLVEKFTPFVRKTIKRPKSAKWMGDERVDFTVQWKKMQQFGHFHRIRGTTPPVGQ